MKSEEMIPCKLSGAKATIRSIVSPRAASKEMDPTARRAISEYIKSEGLFLFFPQGMREMGLAGTSIGASFTLPESSSPSIFPFPQVAAGNVNSLERTGRLLFLFCAALSPKELTLKSEIRGGERSRTERFLLKNESLSPAESEKKYLPHESEHVFAPWRLRRRTRTH